MTLSSRYMARAGTLIFAALTFAACSDPLAPHDVSPDRLQWIGYTIGIEMESGAMQLTAQDVLGTMGCCSRFSEARPGYRVAAASNRQRAAGQPASFYYMIDAECGVPSQNPPTDSDADQVPDNLTITFAVPACRFVDTHDTYELTGVIRVSDPQPGTGAMAFNMALDNHRLTFSQTHAIGFVRRDGVAAVVASATGLLQTVSWRESTQAEGRPTRGADIEWSATFTPAQGASITPGEPLPDGTYAPNGSFVFWEGNRAAHLTITTLEPLQYSAECAANVVAGSTFMSGSPFMSGVVRVSHDDSTGYVDVSYYECSGTGVYVPGR